MIGQVGGAVVGVIAMVRLTYLLLGRLRRRSALTGDQDLCEALDSLLTRRTRRLAVVAVDVGAAKPCRLAFVDADADTPFEIGSVSKALTGLLVADAVERGELTLATSIAELEPGYEGTPLEAVTLGELCTHTAGLSAYPLSGRSALRLLVAAVVVGNPYWRAGASGVRHDAARQRLRGRGQHRYSNVGAAVVGNALAEARGADFAHLLRDRLLLPLSMRATAATGEAIKASRGWTRSGLRSWRWVMTGYAPAGGVVSTAGDVARLLEAMLTGQAPGLSALDPIGSVTAGTPRQRQATFWVVQDAGDGACEMVWHNGETGGYSAFLALYPQRRHGVAVLANVADAAEQKRIAGAVARWLRTGSAGA